MKNNLKEGWIPKRQVQLVSSKQRVIDGKNYRKDGLTNHTRVLMQRGQRAVKVRANNRPAES